MTDVPFSSPDASELSWTYPLHGVPFNWINQRTEKVQQLKVIECVHGERIEQQLEFELNRQLFRFDTRSLNSKKQSLDQSTDNKSPPFSSQ